jgi:carboxyl-terminal processing protease
MYKSFMNSIKWQSLFKALLLVTAGVLLGAVPFGKIDLKNPDSILINSIKFRDLLQVIKTDYVDPTNTDSLTDTAIENMLAELDPHSIYIPKSDVQASHAQLESDFEGIGVELTLYYDSLFITSIAEAGPAMKAGLMPGDVILQVDKKKVTNADIQYKELSDLIRGVKNTKVELIIHRKGIHKPMKFVVVREKIPSYSVEYVSIIAPKIGYIKISRFTQSTAAEFEFALQELKNKGMEQLLLDLRDNAGGYVTAAIKVADLLLEDKKLIYYTKGRNEEYDSKAFATEKGAFEKGAIVVLINEKTASASEIVTGALQDNDRALIVGRRSFGKGLVQAPVTLADGSEVRLTISRYFTPSGRCIQKGYQRGKRQAYFKDLEIRSKSGELSHRDSIKTLGRPVFSTTKGRKILGGGGILPDIFIPKDTATPDQLFQYLHENMMFNYYGQLLYKQYRDQINNLSVAQFNEHFNLPDECIKQFKTFAAEGLTTKDKQLLNRADNDLQVQLKAVIAKCRWQWSGFYHVQIQNDKEVKQALRQFKYAELLANL